MAIYYRLTLERDSPSPASLTRADPPQTLFGEDEDLRRVKLVAT